MKFDYKYNDGVLEIFLAGEMDHHLASEARQQADSLINGFHPKVLFLNMSGISFCDSSGLGFVMGRYKAMNGIGGQMVLVSPSAPVYKMVTLSGMDKLIKIEGV